MGNKIPVDHSPTSQHRPRVPTAWRPQFTLRFLFRTVLLVSILAAARGGLLREGVNPGSGSFLFMLALTVAAPLGVMIVLSVIRTAGNWWRRTRRPAK